MSNRQCTVPRPSKDMDAPGFEVITSPIPRDIPADSVLLKVLACGVCCSDHCSVYGITGAQFPTVPGHEVIGKVVRLGASSATRAFREGDVVGVGWHGGHCFTCEACTDGDFMCCETWTVTGVHLKGGYQEYMVAPAAALARVPEGMDPVSAAPLMCAGVTVFNSLRNVNDKAKPPAIVAVVGIGGLGHLGVQYAAKFGYTVVAVSRGTAKREQALQLGATHFVDSSSENWPAALQALGGAKIILCTAPNVELLGSCLDGLSRNGKLVVLAASFESFKVSPLQLIRTRRSIVGWPAGTSRDSQDAMEFAHLHGITTKTVVFDGVDQAPHAFAAMRRGEYRVVIKIASEAS